MATAQGSTTDRRGRQAETYILAVVLTVLAGFVDATGYVHFHHLFVSFMSGNSTQAAVSAADGNGTDFLVLGRTILLFVGGVVGGEVVAATSLRWGRSFALLVETFLLANACVAAHLHWIEAFPASAMALAMGVQNAVVHKAEGISLALTYVTGTLVHVGRGIAAALRGAAPWRAMLPFLGLWLGLAAGGLLGALVAARSLRGALAVAVAASAILLVWSLAEAMGTSPARRSPG